MSVNRICVFVTCTLLLTAQIGPVIAKSDGDCKCAGEGAKSKAGVKAAIAALTGTLGISTLGTSLVGFTSAGIGAGSVAAFIQSTVGIFGGFSMLQSFGAKGLFALGGPVGLGVGAVLGVGTYLYTSSGGKANDNECSCAVDLEEPTEQEVAQLIALRRIVSCVEPGTAIDNLCGGAGNCEYDKDADEFSCSCQPGHEGLYCEIFKNVTSPNSEQNRNEMMHFPTFPGGESRCKDDWILNCTICMIESFTQNKRIRKCYEKCNWDNHKNSDIRANNRQMDEDAENEIDGQEKSRGERVRLRPDVDSLDLRRVPKMGVIEGTECTVHLNNSCTSVIKYAYGHSDNHLDQLVLYYSTDEIYCDVILKFDAFHILLLTLMVIIIVSLLVQKILKTNYFYNEASSDVKTEKQ